MNKKALVICIGVLVVIGVALLVSQKPKDVVQLSLTPTPIGTVDPNAPLQFSDDTIGISFSYPREWGDVKMGNIDSKPSEADPNAKGKGFIIAFVNNPNVHVTALSKDYQAYGGVAYIGNADLNAQCLKPLNIQEKIYGPVSGIGYCRLFTDKGNYLYESVNIAPLPEGDNSPHLLQRALYNLKNASPYTGLEFYQSFPEVNLAPISPTYSKSTVAQAGFRSYLQTIIDHSAPTSVMTKIDDFEKMMLSLKVK